MRTPGHCWPRWGTASRWSPTCWCTSQPGSSLASPETPASRSGMTTQRSSGETSSLPFNVIWCFVLGTLWLWECLVGVWRLYVSIWLSGKTVPRSGSVRRRVGRRGPRTRACCPGFWTPTCTLWLVCTWQQGCMLISPRPTFPSTSRWWIILFSNELSPFSIWIRGNTKSKYSNHH